jgi:hypothetical protein
MRRCGSMKNRSACRVTSRNLISNIVGVGDLSQSVLGFGGGRVVEAVVARHGGFGSKTMGIESVRPICAGVSLGDIGGGECWRRAYTDNCAGAGDVIGAASFQYIISCGGDGIAATCRLLGK